MNSDIKIISDRFESLGKLLLHVVIRRGDKDVFEQVVNANEADEVIRMIDAAASALNVKSSDVEQQITDHVFQAREWWAKQKAAKSSSDGYEAKFITSAELAQMDAQHRWLIKHVLVRDQPALLGGPKKSMKTSIMLDAAISIGSGRPFLGKFEVPERLHVAVLSGESGAITIRETALRVAASKGLKLAECSVFWGFDLPRLGVDADLTALTTALKDNKVGVVFIDPAYLCLLSGTTDLQANNMFQVGPLLMKVAKLCQAVGTTLILVHHTTKPAGMMRMQSGDPLELEDLAYAGFQEFARQWLLINRRDKYKPGSGKHLMWLNIGGSAGHSGCWGIDVEEGKLGDNFSGRRWQVRVQSAEQAIQVILDAKEAKKEEKKRSKILSEMEAVVQFLLTVPKGETQTGISREIGLHTRVVRTALDELSKQGTVVEIQISKASGNGKTGYPAWQHRQFYTLKVSGNESKLSASTLVQKVEEKVTAAFVPKSMESLGQNEDEDDIDRFCNV